MFDRELANKIDNFIMGKFPQIYDYDFGGIVLLCSGAIRSLAMDLHVKDLDFVVVTQDDAPILDFINKFKFDFSYKKNKLGGYKIYSSVKVDIFSTDDLYSCTEYDADMLFYDIQKHVFIRCGIDDVIKKRTVKQINNTLSMKFVNKRRLRKIVEFIKYITNDKRRVKVRVNKFLWYIKSPFDDFINKITNSNFKKIFRFLKNCKIQFIVIVILGFLLALLSLSEPALLGLVVSNLMNGDYNIIFFLISSMFLLKILTIVLHFILSKLYLIINKTMVNNIRREIMDCLFNLEIDSFTKNNRGNFIEKINSDPNEITRNFNSIKDILIRGFGNFGLIIYICFLDYRIGILVFVFTMIIFIVIMKGIKKRQYYRKKYYSVQERSTSIMGEMINGIGDIKNLNLKDNYSKMAIFSFEDVAENKFRENYYQKIYQRLVSFIEIIAIMCILLLGVYLVQNNLLEVSSLIIIFMYNSTIFSFMDKFGYMMLLLSNLNISCNRIFSLLDGNVYKNEVFGTIYKNKCLGKISFEKVKFRYNSKDNYVLNECSFEVKPNGYVSIVGKSGEGKTTILNLISRLYSANDGVIKLDGIDIRDYSEKFIRDNISVITQSPYLFDMSIKENLRLVKEDITDEEIMDVCKLVCLDEFIESLPYKYDTIIGEGGIKLSGGQKQRLGIARALIKDTKIILLDEITSALDNETGMVIKKVINNIKKDHTIIVVTHELSMIKETDRILVLDSGKIVGDGKHKDLLKDNEKYKKLYKLK